MSPNPIINNGKYMKLPDWMPSDKVDWVNLSSNPNAIPILEQNLVIQIYVEELMANRFHISKV